MAAKKKKTVVKRIAKHKRVRKVETDPAKKAKLLVKRADRLEKLAAGFVKRAASCRAQAAKLAAKTLAKPKCRYSPKLQAALAEIAKLGQELDTERDEAAALKVVADVLKGEFK